MRTLPAVEWRKYQHPERSLPPDDTGKAAVACQHQRGGGGLRAGICGNPSTKGALGRIGGRWATTYECALGHLFAVSNNGQVTDVPKGRPVFGGGAPF